MSGHRTRTTNPAQVVAYRWREHYNAGRDDRWHLENELPKFSYDVEVQPLVALASLSQPAKGGREGMETIPEGG